MREGGIAWQAGRPAAHAQLGESGSPHGRRARADAGAAVLQRVAAAVADKTRGANRAGHHEEREQRVRLPTTAHPVGLFWSIRLITAHIFFFFFFSFSLQVLYRYVHHSTSCVYGRRRPLAWRLAASTSAVAAAASECCFFCFLPPGCGVRRPCQLVTLCPCRSTVPAAQGTHLIRKKHESRVA